MTKIVSTTMASLSALALLLVVPAPAVAQSADDLAKQTQNPIASLISLPLQGNWSFGFGDNDDTATLLNVQPVVPFPISKSTNVILRVIMPLTSQPAASAGGARINGMGDTLATAFFSPSKAGRITWGVGPVVLLPTATDDGLGTGKFGIGPSAVALTQPGKWTLGLLFNHVWSTSGAKDHPDVNQTYLQPFANYNLGGGLAVGVSMEAAANWKAAESWTAPLLFSVSKVTMLATQPVNLSVAAGPMVASPAAGATWRFRMSATFLFPH